MSYFTEDFTGIHGIPSDFSPFTVFDYVGSFDPENLLSLMDHAA